MTFTAIRFNCLAVILAVLISPMGVWAQADVATLGHLHGVVMINHGDGYAIAKDGDVIHTGDHILVMEESAVRVASGHCILHLSENSLRIIGPQGVCETEHLADRHVGPLYAAAIGVIKPKTEPEPEEIEKPPEAPPPGTATPDKVVKKTPDEKTKSAATAGGISSRAIMIGAGVAAALAALGGGGGGGNASTPDH